MRSLAVLVNKDGDGYVECVWLIFLSEVGARYCSDLQWVFPSFFRNLWGICHLINVISCLKSPTRLKTDNLFDLVPYTVAPSLPRCGLTSVFVEKRFSVARRSLSGTNLDRKRLIFQSSSAAAMAGSRLLHAAARSVVNCGIRSR